MDLRSILHFDNANQTGVGDVSMTSSSSTLSHQNLNVVRCSSVVGELQDKKMLQGSLPHILSKNGEKSTKKSVIGEENSPHLVKPELVTISSPKGTTESKSFKSETKVSIAAISNNDGSNNETIDYGDTHSSNNSVNKSKVMGIPDKPILADSANGMARSAGGKGDDDEEKMEHMSRKRSLKPGNANKQEESTRKRLRHDVVPVWAIRADWSNLAADVNRLMREYTQSQKLMSHTNIRDESNEFSDTHAQSNDLNSGMTSVPSAGSETEMDGIAQGRTNSCDGLIDESCTLVNNQSSRSHVEPCITNAIPYNEISRVVADFLFDTVVLGPDFDQAYRLMGDDKPGCSIQYEIEAKFGRLVYKDDSTLCGNDKTGGRIQLPVQTESVLVSGFPARFESSMTLDQHRRINDFLNTVIRSSMETGRQPISYCRSMETDSTYALSQEAFNDLPEFARDVLSARNYGRKVRITRDSKSDEVKSKMIKARVGDLDIYCPRQAFDIRISVNIEVSHQGSMEYLLGSSHANNPPKKYPGNISFSSEGSGFVGKVLQSRRKNRLSYTHQDFRIDLTQVGDPRNGLETCSNELEIELNADSVRSEGRLAQQGLENQFEELVTRFLNNIRVLSRAGTV